ncbi:protein of unknown function [Quadrisphaera granulorum]|uniref:Uncharacterized protein DUF4192 n=1 Tax=Quadrisphaera granulorum TaxID=317664 RepID=A0A315ZVN1_9ACTN|nr:DUF4192 domain-containing protein [Quadrisphaera granulorum]PWJ49263.1 uncharacterized protein DUF4192 [Quadrisphaera granulorum]SZE98180.1 protein of unknown function [Quadrisphaera granulorum]
MTQAERTVIRSGSPFEVLSYAENTLGFRPRESLLLVSLRPPRWRTGMVGRIDVEAADHPELVDEVVRAVVADGAGRCFVALVTDEGETSWTRRPARRTRRVVPRPGRGPASSSAPSAGRPLTGLLGLPAVERAERVCAALLAAGVEAEPWLVHRGRLHSYACDRSCCPAEGLSLDQLASTHMAAEMVLAGRVVAPDRATWERSLRAAVAARPVGPVVSPRRPTDPDELAVQQALAALEARGRRGRPADRAVRSAWSELLRAEDHAPGAASRLDAEQAAVLLDALRRLPVRDQLLATVMPVAAGPNVPGIDPSGSPIDPAIDPASDPALDPDVALAVLEQLARRAPRLWRAAATGCAAWIAWCAGRAPVAGVWAEAALELDPAHSLSQLVQQAVACAVPPPGMPMGQTGGAGAPNASTS